MTDTTLPADYEVGPVVLHADGAITVGGSLTLRNQTLTNHRFADGVLEVVSKRGSTRVDIRFDRGQRRVFEFSRCAWRELSEEEAAGMIWQGILLLRRIHWTTRKAAIAGGGGLLIVCLVVWLVAGGGGEPGRKDSITVSGNKAAAPAVPLPAVAGRVGGDANVTPANGDSQAQAKPKLSDDEILRSQHLTFEEKRSQLYDLPDIAKGVVDELRDQANFARTQSRLDHYEVRLSEEAEHGLSLLVDRVSEHVLRVTEYQVNLALQVSAIHRMESRLFGQLKAGNLDPSLRQLYIEITSQQPPTGLGCYRSVFPGFIYCEYSTERLCGGYETSTFSKVGLPSRPGIVLSTRASILRRSTSANHLFLLLVAIRCCQRSIEVLGPQDDRIGQFLQRLPDDVLTVGGFDRKWPEWKDRFVKVVAERMQQKEVPQATTKPSPAKDNTPFDPMQIGRDMEEERKKAMEESTKKAEFESLLGQMRQVTPTPRGVLMEPKDREQLLAQLAEDAGVLEDALHEQLLDYPWPWKVSTVKPKKKLFELTSQPATEP